MLWKRRPIASDLDAYRHLRRVLSDVHNQHAIRRIPRGLLIRVARDLRMLRGTREILLDDEDEVGFHIDRCIYDLRPDGRTIMEQLGEDAALSPEERQVAAAAAGSQYYSLFEIVGADPERGRVELHDLLGDRDTSITDLAFSRTADDQAGAMIATRVLELDGIAMTSGVACPFLAEQRMRLLAALGPRREGKRRVTVARDTYSAFFFRRYKRADLAHIGFVAPSP